MKYSVLLIITFFLVACGSRQEKVERKQSGKPLVVSVNYPLYYFAQRIGEDLIQLEYPIPEDVDPAYWLPGEEALTLFQSADIILANGAGYAQWMNHVSLPSSRVINTSSKAKDKLIPLKDVHTHSHGPEGEHEHTGFAFTTWLDFQVASIQAEAVKEAIASRLPERREIIEENFDSLQNDLLALNESMKTVSGKLKGQKIIGSHPVYQYLSKAYEMNIQSVHFEPGEMPGRDQWEELDKLLDNHDSGIMLWEDEPLPEIKETLRGKGVRVIVFNPCGNLVRGRTFIEMMNENIQSLQKLV